MSQSYRVGTGTDSVLMVDATSGDEVVTLPLGFASGRKFTVWRVDGTPGRSVTVVTGSMDTLDGDVDTVAVVGARSQKTFSLSDPGAWAIDGGSSSTGPQGPPGANSVVPGPPGTDGVDGAPGADGVDGATGPAPTTYIQDAEPSPAPTAPAYWLDLNDTSTAIAGPQGIQGIPGSDGSDGSNGLNGTNGVDGTDGVDGANGVDGSDGVNGTNGNPGIQGPAGPGLYVGSVAGILTTRTGTIRIYNDTGSTRTITSVRTTVGTAATGATVLVDVNKNGTTIFTTQGNRPSIAISGFASAKATPDVTALADGDYLTFDIDQIGSTIAGADLTIAVGVS